MKRRLARKENHIVYSADAATVYPHRADFVHCPYCQFNEESTSWLKRAHIFVCAVVWRKHGSAALVSECSKCFENSWIHLDLNCFNHYGFPQEWEQKAREEYSQRHRSAICDLANSLCIKCEKLDEVEVGTSAYRGCPRGCGQVETVCSWFESRKPNKEK